MTAKKNRTRSLLRRSPRRSPEARTNHDQQAFRLPHRVVISLFLATLGLTLSVAATGQEPEPVYTSTFSSVAVGGYDPVAYFTNGEPTVGSKSFEWQHRGATWRFASAENRSKFQEDPARYAPQYGGFCAWAMAKGDTAPGKPKFWKIVDDKLYLNYNAKVQRDWLEDPQGFIKRADGHWPDAAR